MTTCIEEEREKAIQSILRRRAWDRQHYLENKEAKNEHDNQYNQEHKEEIAEQQRRYRSEHKDKCNERNRLYHQTHREERLRSMKEYSQEHSGELAERQRQYRLEHEGEIFERNHQYHQEHPEVGRNASRRRRALVVGADGNFTEEEFRLLCIEYENKCIYCDLELPLVPDHAIPLSKGGSNSIENIVPSCASCNKRKQAMTFDEFMEGIVSHEKV